MSTELDDLEILVVSKSGDATPMTAEATVEDTAFTPTEEKVKDIGSVLVNSNGTVDVTFGDFELSELEPGTYRKVTNRIGQAHLTVNTDGELTYTNRAKDVNPITAKEFVRIWKTGLNTLHDGAKPEKTEKPAKAVEPESLDDLVEPTEAELELSEV